MDAGINRIINELDKIKRVGRNGAAYWMARDLQSVLGYANWENFSKVIEKAKMACEMSGVKIDNQILETKKLVEVGSGAKYASQDFFLSRYACYLIAMNGDPQKPEIGIAQTYFAVQTRRQEVQDLLTDQERRIQLRERVRNANRSLSSAAKQSGVQNYAVFHDAGYRGLYGMGLRAIKQRKEIGQKEDLLDRAGRAELAANEFRITQTEQKLVRDKIVGQQKAVETHRNVGAEVRHTIERLGGTTPENLAPQPSIKKLLKGKRGKTPPVAGKGKEDAEK